LLLLRYLNYKKIIFKNKIRKDEKDINGLVEVE
jgi:hypothetical protein